MTSDQGLKDLTHEQRSLDLDYTIDPGFVNHRLIRSTIGVKAAEVVDTAISRLAPLSESLQNTRVGHYYTDATIRLFQHLPAPTLRDLLARERGHLFCSTERLKPADEDEDTGFATSEVLLPEGEGPCVKLHYSNRHVYSDTVRLWLRLGGVFSVVAKFHELVDNVMTFQPLVIGFPWLASATDPTVEEWAMWYGKEYFENFIEDFDEFSLVRSEPVPDSCDPMKVVSEAAFKKCLTHILSDSPKPDWGGETSDHFTTHLHLSGRRLSAAFLLKGPAKFSPMTCRHLGANGDQLVRLCREPASVFFVQHCHEITPPVRETLRALAVQPGNPRRYVLIDGKDSLRLLRAYGLYEAAVSDSA